MNSHYLTPSPSPKGEGSTEHGTTSLAVRRWVEACRGEEVHRPITPVHVESLVAAEGYCLGCYGIRWQDVVIGWTREAGKPVEISVCRACGKEVWHGR